MYLEILSDEVIKRIKPDADPLLVLLATFAGATLKDMNRIDAEKIAKVFLEKLDI